MKKRVVILGATGSIGQNALDIIRSFPQYFELVGFSYHTNAASSSCIKNEFHDAIPLCTQGLSAIRGSTVLGKQHSESIMSNLEAFRQFFTKCTPDVVLNGIAGSEGLLLSYACLSLGIDLCLANKESIVMAYNILKELAKKTHASIIPVDSEHWAIFQLLNMAQSQEIEKLIITASGGAFRDVPSEELKNVSLEKSFNHPTWKMGAKITIDSASLANKALEVIEATKLFDIDANNIIVTVHKESIVHSMVQSIGGSIYAQMSPPAMRCPIFGALMFPLATPKYLKPLDFSTAFSLSFAPPRSASFPMLNLGFDVSKIGAAYPIAFNAANEIAVNAFMNKRMSFIEIPQLVEAVLQNDWSVCPCTLEEIYAVDAKVREIAERWNS